MSIIIRPDGTVEFEPNGYHLLSPYDRRPAKDGHKESILMRPDGSIEIKPRGYDLVSPYGYRRCCEERWKAPSYA
jgi:hypothetical protein